MTAFHSILCPKKDFPQKLPNIQQFVLKSDGNNDLLTGLLGPYQEIRSPIFFVRPELAIVC